MSLLNPIDTGDTHADITNPDLYTGGVPHSTFKRLRDEAPVSWHEEEDGRGFWALTRYDHILEANRQTKIFSSAKGIRLEDMTPEELEARRTMMELDPPEHTTYRRLVNPPFLPRSVDSYDSTLRELAREVIDAARAKNEFDFVEDIARQLPMRMLGKMLGVPDADGPWMVKMGDALIGNADPEFTSHPVGLVNTDDYHLMPFRSPYSYELMEYAAKQAAQRHANPQDDLTTRLLEPTREGERLSDLDFKNFFTLLVAAGNDTTRYTMTAGLHALLTHPEALEDLRAHPELTDSAVEEMLRWGTVTMHFRRTAMEDYQLGGQTIKAGDKVVLWFIAADYDERQFTNPYDFDIRRTPNEHMAFGLKNPHKCIGEHLARLEIKVLLEEMLPQIDSIELNGTPDRLRSNFISGIKHLPVKVSWK
jgi:cytochrome P450